MADADEILYLRGRPRYTIADLVALNDAFHVANPHLSPESMKTFDYLHRGVGDAHLAKYEDDGFVHWKLKDWTGHAQNPANGKIKGVFFSPQTRGTHPPVTESPFGNNLLLFKAEDLIDHEQHNLYFADYYCHRPEVHYITLFVSRRLSRADQFCQENLLGLNMLGNPYFKYNPNTQQFSQPDTMQVWIEVFLTEPVPWRFLHQRCDVLRIGYPRGVGNLECNESCRCCNPPTLAA